MALAIAPANRIIPDFVGSTLDNGRYKFTRVLGSGTSGTVFLADDQATDSPIQVAIKCIRKAQKNTEEEVWQMQAIRFHTAMSTHRNIVTLQRVFNEGDYIFLVMDYYRRGNLSTHLAYARLHRGDNWWIKLAFRQVTFAVEACHDKGIYHCNLKPENFLLADDGRILLTDFEYATNNRRWATRLDIGSPQYRSPECFSNQSNSYIADFHDIWALGIILFKMITGTCPWKTATRSDIAYVTHLECFDFLQQNFHISDTANELFQKIFVCQKVRLIPLDVIRYRVILAGSLFMAPEDIARGGPSLKDNARTYFRGSPREKDYFADGCRRLLACERTRAR